MQQILLDTNFILSCIRNKLDLFEELKFRGYTVIIPEQIINEIEKIKISVKKLRFRKEAELALRILKKHNFEKILLEGKNVDNAIVNYARQYPDLTVATLDNGIQKKLKKKNKIMILRNRNALEII
jgi:rRNA-processing protein FCF1